MPSRREDVEKIKKVISTVEELKKEVPPGYRGIENALDNANNTARQNLGVLLAELELGE